MKLYIGRIEKVNFCGSPDDRVYAYVLAALKIEKQSNGEGFLSESNMKSGFGQTLEEMEENLRRHLDTSLASHLGNNYNPEDFSFTYNYNTSGEGDEDGLFWPGLWMCGSRVEVAK